MWIYFFKVLTLVASVFLLKLILAVDVFDYARIYLKALAVAGALSLLEFGLGDYFLQQIKAGKADNNFAVKVHRLLYGLLIASGVCVWYFARYSLSSQEVIVTAGIFLYSIANVLLGVHLKVSYIITGLRSSYKIFSFYMIIVIFASVVWLALNGIDSGALIILLYGGALLTFLIISDFQRLAFITSDSNSITLKAAGRMQLGMENVLNSVALMLLGLTIASLPEKQDVEIFSVYARVVNVLAMFGMLYTLSIWQADRERLPIRIIVNYLLASLLIIFTLTAFEEYWVGFIVRDMRSQISLSLTVATSLICWRVLADMASQMSKFKSMKRIAVWNAIAQCILVCAVLLCGQFGLLSSSLFSWVLALGGSISCAFLISIIFCERDSAQ